jgi:hypothetical protein
MIGARAIMLHAACIDPMLCRRAYIFAENENGPDVKLGSKRQGRYRLLDWEKPEEPNLCRDSSPTR